MSHHEHTSSWLERLSHALLREPQDREQLINLLHDAQERDLLDASSLKMIEGVLQISEQQVRDIMVPRAEMVVIEQDQSFNDILPVVIESGHSRFPVIGDNRDEIKGLLLAKDLLPFQLDNQSGFDIKKLLRPAMLIPESKPLDTLLHEFRAQHSHMAIVVDEYGCVSGLITIEDILEEIVGDIEDEYDEDEHENIAPKGTHHFVVKALTPIDEFNQYFKTDFDENEVDTIGGMVVRAFGRVPKKGEITTIRSFKFKILQSDNRRLHSLRVTPPKKK
ncbi:MAG: CBS domain-containing protein [Gammaproteobacteria bacterium]|nr:CBS domain-containing protein [Gammaproteobacteria bacterium]